MPSWSEIEWDQGVQREKIHKDPITREFVADVLDDLAELLGDPRATSEFQRIPSGLENILNNRILVIFLVLQTDFIINVQLFQERKEGVAARKNRVTNALSQLEVLSQVLAILLEDDDRGVLTELTEYWNGNEEDARDFFEDLLKFWHATVLLNFKPELNIFSDEQLTFLQEETEGLGEVDVDTMATELFPRIKSEAMRKMLFVFYWCLKSTNYLPVVDLPNLQESYIQLIEAVESDPATRTQT